MLLSFGLISTWNIKRFIFGRDNLDIIDRNNTNLIDKKNSTEDMFIAKVYYPLGSSSPSKNPLGGVGFYAKPDEIKNAIDVTLSYSVKFDETFKPVVGGKLPGLFINKNDNYIGGSGGKHTNNTSCRIAWRSDFLVEAYVYLPKDNFTKDNLPKDNIIRNKIYGDSIWRGDFKFDNKNWNNIKLRIRLNTFNSINLPNNDGVLELSINDKKKGLYNIIWTLDPENRVETIIFETFFGGSSPKAVTPVNTWSFFKNVNIEKNE